MLLRPTFGHWWVHKEVVFAGFLSLVGSLLGGPIAGLPIKAGLSEFLPASTGVLIAGGSHSSVRRSLRTTLTAQARQKCTVHGRRTVARRRKRSLSDKSTNVAISARRREVSFTLPGLLVHGCRARGKRCQTEEAPFSWKRMSDSGDGELKRRYPPGLRLYWYDKSLHRESRKKEAVPDHRPSEAISKIVCPVGPGLSLYHASCLQGERPQT